MSDASLIVAAAATSHPSPLWMIVLVALNVLDDLPTWWLKMLVAIEETRRLKHGEPARHRRRKRR